jgi:hypothetical protein
MSSSWAFLCLVNLHQVRYCTDPVMHAAAVEVQQRAYADMAVLNVSEAI